MSLHAAHSLHGSRLHAACACASSRRFTPGSTQRKYERSRPFQVTHLALDLDVGFKDKSIQGSATLSVIRRAPAGTELRLDAVGLQIARVELRSPQLPAGKKKAAKLKETVDYQYDSKELIVSIPPLFKEGELYIEYSANPRLGLYFLSPDKKVPNRPHQVWSQCQDEDGRHWFPCQDKPHVKMSYELRARVPHGMSVLSGGELLEKKTPKKGAWVFHYRLDVPTPAYLLTLVVGKFDEWQEKLTLPSGKKIPLRYLVPPGKIQDGKRAFHRTKEAIELFSEKTGIDYPFDRYSQVVVSDFIFGGMENTTATTMYEHILLDKKASLDIDSYDLVAHELAHQWFGDLVTCRDWSHAWLNEGFATYFEHVEREARLGLDEYEHNVTCDLNAYLSEARGDYQRAIVCRDYVEPIDLFDRHLYQKGGLVLHMLRREIGDNCFWQGVKNYLQAHRGGIVETNDLMRAFEETSGQSLEKFFDQWVYRPGHPELKVSVSYSSEVLVVDVEQTQKGADIPVFEVPFEIEVDVDGETILHRRILDERKLSLVLPLKTRPQRVTIDPEYRIAAPISLKAPADLLRSLLSGGKRARARRMAALALSKQQDPDTIVALQNCLKNNKELWMVRAQAAHALSKIRGEKAELALLRASKVEDTKVRRAVATALGTLRTEKGTSVLRELTGDPSYLVSASAARALGNCPAPQTIKTLVALLKKDSWSDVVRAGALAALAQIGDDDEIKHLITWSAYGKPLRARRAAIAALPQLGEGRKVRSHLVEMLHDRDPHIRSAVLSALGTLGDPKVKADIDALLDRELDGGVCTRAREILSDLGKSGSRGLKEARETNQKLQQEMGDLKTRLARIEQLMTEKEKPSGAKKASRLKKPR